MERCTYCHDLKDFQKLISYTNLRRGVTNKCGGCQLIYEGIERFSQDDEAVDSIYLNVDYALYGLCRNKEGFHFQTIEYFTDPGIQCKHAKIGPARAVSVDASSDESLAIISRWLENCLKNHPKCRSDATTVLPLRVIDVSTSQPKLYETNSENEPYVALSHCWGADVGMATTVDTLAARLEAITFDKSTKCFADAVRITQALGIKYLWIDALCIIQDDEEDLAIETVNMYQDFNNATVTLSADYGSDVADGLFATPELREAAHKTFTIDFQEPGGSRIPVNARSRVPSSDPLLTVGHSSVKTSCSKLSNYGWAVQQRLLSPRTIHFYPEEIVWTCASQQRCECRLTTSISPLAAYRGLFSDTAFTQDERKREINIEWTNIIQNYTRKTLSNEKDRLPAISGLANMIETITSAQGYFAGMWDWNQSYGLVWYSDHTAAEEMSKTTARIMEPEAMAPSWSWASIDGPVSYIDIEKNPLVRRRTGKDEIRPLLQVLRSATTPATANPFGNVIGGYVTVSGQLLPVRYVFDGACFRPRDLGSSEQEFRPAVEPEVIWDVIDEDPDYWADPDGDDDTALDYYFLRAGQLIVGGVWTSPSRENVCLLVKKIQRETQDRHAIYRRQGFVFYGFSSDTVWNSPAVKEPQVLVIV